MNKCTIFAKRQHCRRRERPVSRRHWASRRPRSCARRPPWQTYKSDGAHLCHWLCVYLAKARLKMWHCSKCTAAVRFVVFVVLTGPPQQHHLAQTQSSTLGHQTYVSHFVLFCWRLWIQLFLCDFGALVVRVTPVSLSLSLSLERSLDCRCAIPLPDSRSLYFTVLIYLVKLSRISYTHTLIPTQTSRWMRFVWSHFLKLVDHNERQLHIHLGNGAYVCISNCYVLTKSFSFCIEGDRCRLAQRRHKTATRKQSIEHSFPPHVPYRCLSIPNIACREPQLCFTMNFVHICILTRHRCESKTNDN